MQPKEKFSLKHSGVIKPLFDGDGDYDFWLLLSRARYAFYRARELELSRYGLTPEQVLILFVVHSSEDKNTPAALARKTLLQPHTVSSMVNRLEKKGLLKKARDVDHKTQIRVSITEKGEEAYQLSRSEEHTSELQSLR